MQVANPMFVQQERGVRRDASILHRLHLLIRNPLYRLLEFWADGVFFLGDSWRSEVFFGHGELLFYSKIA